MRSGFFAVLGRRAGTQQQENQLSSTFQACFQHSAAFRHVVVSRLWAACRLPKSPPKAITWTCSVEVPPPTGTGGRVDIAIRPDPSRRSLPVFWLESKVESPLTHKQIEKYKKNKCDYLIALTKRRPEITPSEMKQLRAFTLRWQDLHADFAKSVGASQKERFLIRSFQEYLEELGMAHRERISIRDMKQLRGVLKTLRSANKYAVVKDAFDTADSVVELLDGIRVRLIEDHPSMRKLKRSGVTCGSEVDESGGSQSMGWHLRTGKWADWHFGVGVSFGEPVSFWAYLEGDKVKRFMEAGWTLKQVCRSGTIDEDKLYGLIRKTARSWGVAKR